MAVYAADSIWFNATSTGLGDFVVASAVAAYRTPATAATPNGSIMHYSARTATEFENGEGAYNSGTSTLARTTIFASSNANAKVNFGSVPTVALSPLAEDAIFPPASSTDNAIVLWDGTAGDSVKNSSITVSGSGTLSGTNTGNEAASSTTVAGIAEIATAAEWRTSTDTTRHLGVADTWGAAAEVALTFASPTTSWDMATGLDFSLALTSTVAMGNPTNTTVGKKGRLRVVHTNVPSTLTWGTNYEFASATAPTLSTVAADEDVLYYDVISSTRILILTGAKDIS